MSCVLDDDPKIIRAESMKAMRAGIIAARKAGAIDVRVVVPCDKNGRTATDMDVLAALVAAQGMGACAYELESLEDLTEQVTRLSEYAAIPLFVNGCALDIVPCQHDMLCATASEAFLIDPTIQVSEPIPCDAHLPEALIDAEESAAATYVVVENDDDLDAFAEHQYMIGNPLCIGAESAELLERTLAAYDGRAFYDGRGTVSAADLHRLRQMYGLLVL